MIYDKEKMLLTLRGKGFNIFEYKILLNDAELIEYHRFHKNFTIRFTKVENCPNLPFYIINEGVPSEKLVHVALEARLMGCVMLVSDGIRYEKNQVLNFVFCKKINGDFLIEYKIGKEPLRLMYEHRMTQIKGNLYKGKEDWEFFEGPDKNKLGFTDLEYILEYISNANVYNKYVECTLYDKAVGINKERVIVWGF